MNELMMQGNARTHESLITWSEPGNHSSRWARRWSKRNRKELLFLLLQATSGRRLQAFSERQSIHEIGAGRENNSRLAQRLAQPIAQGAQECLASDAHQRTTQCYTQDTHRTHRSTHKWSFVLKSLARIVLAVLLINHLFSSHVRANWLHVLLRIWQGNFAWEVLCSVLK